MDPATTPRITSHELMALRSKASPLVIDARREAAFQAAPDRIAGAIRRDPATLADWAGTLPAAKHLVVYCVHGHEVSQKAAGTLCERGLAARFLEGGIEAWRAAGGDLVPNTGRAK